MVRRCLARQSTSLEWEWLVCSPFRYESAIWVPEPEKKPGDYYNLNKAMNALYDASRGELLIQITDWIWFPPDTLQKLWDHYQRDPKGLVSGVGDQFSEVENGKPESLVWVDPRKRTDQGTFYQINPIDMEFCLGSLPKSAVVEVGGADIKYDQGAAVGEKEMCLRMDKLGFRFYIDQTLEYRAVKHERLSPEWDSKYKIASEMFMRHVADINSGARLKVNNHED